ncbi:hypothetical protein C8J56DRAFT_977987 [Mycena floridula]|nr:hypothetical protein C8J56DRAFT_977987 [Mycena floridula]
MDLPSKGNGSSMVFLLAASLSCRFAAILFLSHCLSLCSSPSIFPFNETKRIMFRCPSSLARTICGYRLAPSLAAIPCSTEKNHFSSSLFLISFSQFIVHRSTRTNN